MSYAPERDPLAALDQPSRGTISVYAQGEDYHDVIKAKLKELASRVQDAARRREGLRRYRAGDGEAARGRRPVSAGRASTPISCRASSAPGCSSARSSPPPSSPRTRRRRIIAAPAAAASTSARPTRSRALSARCAALHRLPDHRAQRAHRARVSASHGQPHLRLRRLPRRLPLEQVRERGARSEAAACARRPTTRRLPSCSSSTMPAFRARFRGTPVKRTGRDRFVRNVLIAAGNSGDADACAASGDAVSAMPRRWCAPWRCGRCRGLRRIGRRRLRESAGAGRSRPSRGR